MPFSAQAWDDVRFLTEASVSLPNQVGALRVSLAALKAKYEEIVADPARTQEDVALADTHPVNNSAKLTGDVGKFLALDTWLEANGYYS